MIILLTLLVAILCACVGFLLAKVDMDSRDHARTVQRGSRREGSA